MADDKQNELAKQDQKRTDAVKDIPAHEGERAVTRDTTPAVERPGHETTKPDRPEL